VHETKAPSFRKFNRPLYHITSRCCNRDFYLDAAGREKMCRLIRDYAAFCGVQVLAYCVMSNHIHILAEVPPCPPESVDDTELLRRLQCIYPESSVALTAAALANAAALGGEAGAALREKARAPHLRRMGVLAEFVKALKQCFTQWFNKRNEREGTAWEGRFRSALVGGDSPEGTAAVLRVIAAYIDLNPVRAGIVADPGAYRWSSWGAAAGGDGFALAGYGRLLGKGAEGRVAATAAQLAAYRAAWLEGPAAQRRVQRRDPGGCGR
jgi:putative transposase